MKSLRIAAVFVAALAMAACSSQAATDRVSAPVASTAPSSPPSAVSPAASSSPVVSPTAAPPAAVTLSTPAAVTTRRTTSKPSPDVKAQLLPLTAMPAGWSVNPDTSSSSTSSALGKCKSNPKTGAAASASYVGGTSGIPEFNETIAYRPGTAAKDMAAFAKTLDGCKTFTADSGGTKITGTIERMNVPKIGAATDAWQIALTASGLTFGMDVVAFRTATEDVSVQYAGFGSPDVNTVVGLCRKAFARL